MHSIADKVAQAGKEQNCLVMTAHFKARTISMRNQFKINSFGLAAVMEHLSLSMIERDYLDDDEPMEQLKVQTKKAIPNFELLDQVIKLGMPANAITILIIEIIICWK